MDFKTASTSKLLTVVSVLKERSVLDMTDTDWDNLIAAKAEIALRS